MLFTSLRFYAGWGRSWALCRPHLSYLTLSTLPRTHRRSARYCRLPHKPHLVAKCNSSHRHLQSHSPRYSQIPLHSPLQPSFSPPGQTYPSDNISSLPVTSSLHAASPPQAAVIPTISVPLPAPLPPPPHVIPSDDSSFTHQTPPIRRSGYVSLVDHESELSGFYSRSCPFTSRSSGQCQPLFNTSLPSNRRKFKLRSTPSRRCSDDDDEHPPETDWRDFLSQSQDYNPRRMYELLQSRSQLLEELTRTEISII